MTLEQAKALVSKAGFAVSNRCWEDEGGVYACSEETHRQFSNHPKFEAHLSKLTGWLTVTNSHPVRVY